MKNESHFKSEFEGVDYDQLLELATYYKSEYVLLSVAYNQLKRENKDLKIRNTNLNHRFNNLQKIVDNQINTNLFSAHYEVTE